MTILENRIDFIDDVLKRIAHAIQLDDTRRERALRSYGALTDLLEQSIGEEKLETYAQGSFRIGTTVRPLTAEEYDLDFVVEFVERKSNYSVLQTLEQVYSALASSKVYENKLELKSRCVRVTYENEFHVDVLPAIPDASRARPALLVPDRDQQSWTPSSPKGYAEWFESIAKEPMIREMLEKALVAEPIPPDPDLPYKAPLKIAVQLLKRRRDVMLSDSDWKPSSILLTTLLGREYSDNLSPFKSLQKAMSGLVSQLSFLDASAFRVTNPTNEQEDFTDKWDDRKRSFSILVDMVGRFARELDEVETQVADIVSASNTLCSMFGEEVTKSAFSEQAEYIRKAKDTGSLRLNHGTSTATRVKENTFYGDRDSSYQN